MCFFLFELPSFVYADKSQILTESELKTQKCTQLNRAPFIYSTTSLVHRWQTDRCAWVDIVKWSEVSGSWWQKHQHNILQCKFENFSHKNISKQHAWSRNNILFSLSSMSYWDLCVRLFILSLFEKVIRCWLPKRQKPIHSHRLYAFVQFALFVFAQTKILHALMQQPTHRENVLLTSHMTISRQSNFFCVNWVAVAGVGVVVVAFAAAFFVMLHFVQKISVVNWNLNAMPGNWPNSKPYFFRKFAEKRAKTTKDVSMLL